MECAARGSPPPDIIWVRSDGTAVGDVPGLRQVSLNLYFALLSSFIEVFSGLLPISFRPTS